MSTPDRVVDMLVDAFLEDPLYRWLYPDPACRPAALRANMQLILDLANERGVVQHTAADDAVAVWTQPGSELLDDPEPLLDLLSRWAPERVDHAVAGLTAVNQHRPPEPVWILHLLAVRTKQQGRGLAAELIQPMLDRCDQDAVGAYLESSNRRNLGFYRRAGFALLAEVDVPAQGPTMFPMLRPAAP